MLKKITKNVWGFDLNPLAVQMSRLNYLIAISDLVSEAPGMDIELPILLADAIYAPAPDDNGDTSVVEYVIGSDMADLKISLPTVLTQDRKRLDAVFSIMTECIDQEMESGVMLDTLFSQNIINSGEKGTWNSVLSKTYKRVQALHNKGWNGIWFRIVRNYFWSTTTGDFEISTQLLIQSGDRLCA